MSAPKKLLIVDDHPIVRQGIIRMLSVGGEFAEPDEASTAQEALGCIDRSPPDVMIADISLKSSDGLDLIKSIRALDHEFPILVVSMHDETLYAERVLRAGGNGYLMKEEAADQLNEALSRVMSGHIYVSQAMQERFLQNMVEDRANREGGVNSLSDRELEVYRHIGQGRSTREIAEMLNLSIKTIETHRAHIKDKLDLANASELVATASRWVQQQEEQ